MVYITLLVESISRKKSFLSSGVVSFCGGFINIYFVVEMTLSRSIADILWVRYSFTFSVLSLLTPTVNVFISSRDTLSEVLSKNRYVNARKPAIISPRNNIARVGLVESTIPDTMSQVRDPIP